MMKSYSSEKWLNRLWRVIIRETLFPLGLILATVTSAVVIPYIVVHKNSFTRDIYPFGQISILSVVKNAWRVVEWRDCEVWSIIAVFACWASISILFPGSLYYGPPTLSGFRPVYKKSGFLFYVISMAIIIPVLSYVPVLHLYYKFVTFAGILTAVGLVMSCLLFIKGHTCPSPGVFGSSGNPLFDFYWGLELYPRLGPFNLFDLKTIVNCRFGLWFWQAIVLWAWKANYELEIAGYNRGFINWPLTCCTLLQTVYLAKFYYWEDGYMSTIDISVDKFGFYVGWGCIAWVPTFYTLTSVYLIKHSPVNSFGFGSFLFVTAIGLLMIFLNYEADRQRQLFRQTSGKCTIWGKQPKAIHAMYQNDEGHAKQSMLLASGLWGSARHFNYAFELGAALSWAVPALTTSLIPYFYFGFLFVLLVHRSVRDDDKCKNKYGKYWQKYCNEVPYRILPYVY